MEKRRASEPTNAGVVGKLRRMQALEGDWKLNGTLRTEGRERKVEGFWNLRPAAGGWGLLGEMQADVDGFGTYEEVDVFAYDPAADKYRVHSVSSTGVSHDHQADWRDPADLKMSFREKRAGRALAEEAELEILGPDEFVLKSVDRVDGDEVLVMDFDMVRNRPDAESEILSDCELKVWPGFFC